MLSEKNLKKNEVQLYVKTQFINPLLLILQCCGIVATFDDNHNRHIVIGYTQKLNKGLAEIKQNKITEPKLNLNRQSIYRLYLSSNVVASAVL